MTVEISSVIFIVSIASAVFIILGTLLSVMFFLSKRNERYMERLDSKIDNAVERIEANQQHAVEKIETNQQHATEKIETKLDNMTELLYILNGQLQRLIGRVFGNKSLVEEDKIEEKELV
ncbi:MAG: hypothetical protein OXF06_02800 [Bacteroidetes bacterium]|nr:hypothetical protein [Bacteroidota bacterium]MCY4223743.1 hypothetical protein [Bacteroidota bacterium]